LKESQGKNAVKSKYLSYSILISNSDYSRIFASKLVSNVYPDTTYKDYINNEMLGIKTDVIKGSKQIISWGKTSNGQIMLTLTIPYSSISEKALLLSRTVLLITISVMLVLLAVVILVTKYLYKPIKGIMNTASSLYKTQSPISEMELINQSFMHLNTQVETMQKTLYENRHIIEYRLLMDLTQNRIKYPHEIEKKLETLKKSVVTNQLFIVITKIEPQKSTSTDIQIYEYMLFKIRDKIKNSFSDSVLINAVYSEDSIVTLFNCADAGQFNDIPEDLFKLVSSETDLKFNVAFSKKYENILDTYKYFPATEKHLRYSFILGYQNIFSPEKIQELEEKDYVVRADEIKFIEAKTYTGRVDELKFKIKHITTDMKNNYSIGSIQNSLLTIINVICVAMSEINITLTDEQKRKTRDIFYDINHIDDFVEFVSNLLDDCNEILKNRYSYGNDFSQKLFEYVENNIQNELSLASISDYFNMSQGYLSRLFKESTGYGFSEHIVNKKLEKASYLLESQNLSVKDISESLGYFKLSYFSKIFKEKYGVTPTQYRKANARYIS
jgi:AraC-like DNA-binding protein